MKWWKRFKSRFIKRNKNYKGNVDSRKSESLSDLKEEGQKNQTSTRMESSTEKTTTISTEKVDARIIDTKKDKIKLKSPSLPLPKYNEDVDYDEFKEHYLFYLTYGSNYERKVVMQKVKKAVRKNKERHLEWINPLIDVSTYNDYTTRRYAFFTLLSFPLNDIHKESIFNRFENDSDYVIKKRVQDERNLQNQQSNIINPEVKNNDSIKVIKERVERKNPQKNKSEIKIKDSIIEFQKAMEEITVTTEELSKDDFKSSRYLRNRGEIQSECKMRNIESIYHFTNERNIHKIMSNGILSVEELKGQSLKYEWNDSNRIDNMLHASCWSISFTNTMYFYTARKRQPEMKWCVIECDASPLWELECHFYETNAASTKMKRVHYSERISVNFFRKMFAREGIYTLPANYPTDVQGEVLITEPVLPTKIKAIYTDDQSVYNYYNEIYPGIFKYDDKHYRYRN